MAVQVAVTLRLADLMAGGANHLEELAEQTSADAHTVRSECRLVVGVRISRLASQRPPAAA
jgi:hypothetical protein